MIKKKKIDEYLFKDNLQRYLLKEMLVKKTYLKDLTIKEIDGLVQSINTLVSNLGSNIKEYKKMIEISDTSNWDGNSLFRDIIIHNVLDIDPSYGGTTRDFKTMLEKRWEKRKKNENK